MRRIKEKVPFDEAVALAISELNEELLPRFIAAGADAAEGETLVAEAVETLRRRETSRVCASALKKRLLREVHRQCAALAVDRQLPFRVVWPVLCNSWKQLLALASERDLKPEEALRALRDMVASYRFGWRPATTPARIRHDLEFALKKVSLIRMSLRLIEGTLDELARQSLEEPGGSNGQQETNA